MDDSACIKKPADRKEPGEQTISAHQNLHFKKCSNGLRVKFWILSKLITTNFSTVNYI